MASDQKRKRDSRRFNGSGIRGEGVVRTIGRQWRLISAGAAGGILGAIIGYLPLNEQRKAGELPASTKIRVANLLEDAASLIPQMEAISKMGYEEREKKFGSEENARKKLSGLQHSQREYWKKAEKISRIKFTGIDLKTVRKNRGDAMAAGYRERNRRTEKIDRYATSGIVLGAAIQGIRRIRRRR